MEEILRILEEDCRLSADEIARMTGRPADEVKSVIADCEAKGIIRRYKAVVNWDIVDQDQVFAFIDVSVCPERGVGFDDVAERIFHFPEVHSMYLVSGTHDLRVVVGGPSMKEVAFFVAEKLATIDNVQATTTHFLLKRYKEDGVILVDTDGDKRLAVSP